MKGIKKNHIIITALAIMIAIAGYINYAEGIDDLIKNKGKDEPKNEELIEVGNVLDSDEEDEIIDEPGTVVLTSGKVRNEQLAQAKLNREQLRASSEEELMNIINNKDLTEDAKKSAVEQYSKLKDISEKEVAIELLLSAKGFDNSVVSISENSVDAVLEVVELSEKDKAQVEDIIKRKTGFEASQISINICK